MPARRGRPPGVLTRNKPGRPEGTLSQVRDNILDAAEIVFSDLGYAGTTLREVAQASSVTQALIIYYFGSKYGLFEGVFLRRGRQISDERMALLHNLESSASTTVKDIMLAFLKPTLALRDTKQGKAFIRLQARLHTEPPEISYDLRKDAYDTSTKAFVAALLGLLPHLTEGEVYWRITMTIGAYMYAFSDTHRLEQLAPGLCDPDNTDEILENIVAYATAGIEAPGLGKAR